MLASSDPRSIVAQAASFARRAVLGLAFVTISCARMQPAPVTTPVISAPVPAPTFVLRAIESPLPGGPPRQAPPRATWSLKHARFVGMEMALAPDGSIYVAGADANRRSIGGRPVLWLAKLSAEGKQLWGKTVRVGMRPGGVVTPSPAESVEVTIAVDRAGRVNVVNLSSIDAPHSILRRFAPDNGKLLDKSILLPEITALRADPSGHLIGAGVRLIRFDHGQPHASLWLGGLIGTKLAWQREVVGTRPSYSHAMDLVARSAGRYVVVGARGTGPHNSGDAWVGSGTADGGWSWNAIPLAGSRAVSLCAAHDGDVVVAGREFVARFDPRGQPRWIRGLDAEPAVVHCLPEGYLLGFAARLDHTKETIFIDRPPSSAYLPMRLEMRDWDHTLRWRLEDAACQAVRDLKSSGTAVFVLKNCNRRFALTRYDLSSDPDASRYGGSD